jgi:dolichol-phosphate mannosyltransferase
VPRRPKTTVDIVLPHYNEAEAFEETYGRLRAVVDKLPQAFTFYCVDDGSRDGTSGLVQKLAKRDRRIRLIELSRNFGHQAALTAGLAAAKGDVVITMDGDGQHPPSSAADAADQTGI